jgi:hypothetical protein
LIFFVFALWDGEGEDDLSTGSLDSLPEAGEFEDDERTCSPFVLFVVFVLRSLPLLLEPNTCWHAGVWCLPTGCLFIGDLARGLSEDQLREAFEQFGVISVEIKRDRVTNYSLGYGFVLLKSRCEAASSPSLDLSLLIGHVLC